MAWTLAKRIPPNVDIHDLIQVGMIAAMHGILRFEVDRGIRLEAYLYRRILGAMLDELRVNDWMPRLVRQKQNQAKRAKTLVERRKDCPTNADVAAEMSLTQDEYHYLMSMTHMVSMDELDDDELPASLSKNPEEILMAKQEAERLLYQIKQLPGNMRMVVSMIFTLDLSQADMGKLLGVTESRVSQIRTEVITRIRDGLRVAT